MEDDDEVPEFDDADFKNAFDRISEYLQDSEGAKSFLTENKEFCNYYEDEPCFECEIPFKNEIEIRNKISKDDIVNLQIAFNTAKNFDDFLNMI